MHTFLNKEIYIISYYTFSYHVSWTFSMLLNTYPTLFLMAPKYSIVWIYCHLFNHIFNFPIFAYFVKLWDEYLCSYIFVQGIAVAVQNTTGVQLPGFKSWLCHLLAIWLWVILYFSFPNLRNRDNNRIHPTGLLWGLS